MVPGVAAPFDATPFNINAFRVSTADLLFDAALGLTLSAMAAAIFSALTLKFIFSTKDVCDVDFKPSRRAESAAALLDLGVIEEAAVFASGSEYIPTE